MNAFSIAVGGAVAFIGQYLGRLLESESREPDGDGWNLYSSASWAVNNCITKPENRLDFFDVFLHCFSQNLLIKAINQ